MPCSTNALTSQLPIIVTTNYRYVTEVKINQTDVTFMFSITIIRAKTEFPCYE